MKNMALMSMLALVYAYVSDMDFQDHQLKETSEVVVQSQSRSETGKLTGADVLRTLKNRSIAASKHQLSS